MAECNFSKAATQMTIEDQLSEMRKDIKHLMSVVDVSMSRLNLQDIKLKELSDGFLQCIKECHTNTHTIDSAMSDLSDQWNVIVEKQHGFVDYLIENEGTLASILHRIDIIEGM